MRPSVAAVQPLATVEGPRTTLSVLPIQTQHLTKQNDRFQQIIVMTEQAAGRLTQSSAARLVRVRWSVLSGILLLVYESTPSFKHFLRTVLILDVPEPLPSKTTKKIVNVTLMIKIANSMPI